MFPQRAPGKLWMGGYYEKLGDLQHLKFGKQNVTIWEGFKLELKLFQTTIQGNLNLFIKPLHIAFIFQRILTFSLWRTLAKEILGYNVYWPKLDDDFSDKCWNSKLNWHQPTLQDCLRKIIDTLILSMNRLCNFQLSYFLLEVGNSRCIRVVLSEIRAIVGL